MNFFPSQLIAYIAIEYKFPVTLNLTFQQLGA